MSFLFEKAKGSIHVFWLQNKPLGIRFLRDSSLVIGTLCVSALSFGASKIEYKREVQCPILIENAVSSVPSKETDLKSGINDGTIAKNSSESTVAPSAGLKTSDALSGAGGRVVASKNGTKYHYPWCAGANQIKEENKVWYENEIQAQQAGLTKAKNCQ